VTLSDKENASSSDKVPTFFILSILVVSLVVLIVGHHVTLCPMEAEMSLIRHQINELKRDIGIEDIMDNGVVEYDEDLIIQNRLQNDPELSMDAEDWREIWNETLSRFRRSDGSEGSPAKSEREKREGKKEKKKKRKRQRQSPNDVAQFIPIAYTEGKLI
jgi:hypothetical protein